MLKFSKLILLFLILTLAAGYLNAQYARKYKLPAARTETEKQLLIRQHATPDPVSFYKTGFQMPPNVRYPGEFEESQAVFISWAPDLDFSGNVIGVDTYSAWGYVSAQVAKAVSDNLPVWIRVPFAKDTNTVKNFMATLGWNLTKNYRFFVFPGDDWWTRDFGPNGIYFGAKDSIGFIDLKYYAGRDNDDKCPIYLSQKLGYKNFTSTMNGEGGNLMTDGFGKIFFSTMFPAENTAFGSHNPAWTQQQALDTIRNLFNDSNLVNLKTLICDGGTGHIDLYVKLMDEQTLLVAKYPDTVTAIDKKTIEDNFQILASMKSIYNRPYRIFRVPDATRDDGTYNISCDSINFDARTFINGLAVNNVFIYPSYSDGVTGNQAQTNEVTALYQKILPGMKIIPIDSRDVTTNGGGGAIHCITMQIPAENPVLFWHPSIDGLQPLGSNFHIVAKISNNSGIASAKCMWKVKGNSPWNALTLTLDTSGNYVGNIVTGTLTDNDQIQYYLTATTNNGKTAVKPLTAPNGFYTILFKYAAGVNTLEQITEKNYLFGAYPNPALNSVTIAFDLIQNGDVKIVLSDLLGKETKSMALNNSSSGLHKIDLDVTYLNSGIYFYSMYLNGEKISTRKLIISK